MRHKGVLERTRKELTLALAREMLDAGDFEGAAEDLAQAPRAWRHGGQQVDDAVDGYACAIEYMFSIYRNISTPSYRSLALCL